SGRGGAADPRGRRPPAARPAGDAGAGPRVPGGGGRGGGVPGERRGPDGDRGGAADRRRALRLSGCPARGGRGRAVVVRRWSAGAPGDRCGACRGGRTSTPTRG